MHVEERRSGDLRDEFQRDRARIVHSAGFRRLQGKTQVMGVGEGDFHRTRLTHSLEVAQIAEGILTTLRRRRRDRRDEELQRWLPTEAALDAACLAHDLGHPPYGHGGERALQERMVAHGGFEGNAQTLRILVKLERYRRHSGVNPTRRTVLGVLKYPVAYEDFDPSLHRLKPPKCHYGRTEGGVVSWAMAPFPPGDRRRLAERGTDGKPVHRCLDASIMECADDIAYAVHDLEDVVARRLVRASDVEARLGRLFATRHVGPRGKRVSRDTFVDKLFGDSLGRKRLIGRLVNLLVTEAEVRREDFEHPMLRLRVGLDSEIAGFIEGLKDLTIDLVAKQAAVRQLERRGQRIVKALFDEMLSDPEGLVPASAWRELDPADSKERRVCDYVAGMTDPYAERVYQRLFTPGFGSSADEL